MNRMNGPAALTSALLVRKGAAVPAGYVALAASARALRAVSPEPASAADAEPQSKRRRVRAAPDPRTRLSLRLDPERHLKLKLSAAHLQQSLQDLLTAALDGYLEQVGPAVMNGKCLCLDGGCAAPGQSCE